MEAILRESEEARGRILDGYSGYHNRTHPDSNGWSLFEVYHRDGGWYWSACDNCGEHKGAESTKFPSSCKAYYDGVNNP